MKISWVVDSLAVAAAVLWMASAARTVSGRIAERSQCGKTAS